jgi:hypothetical protein
MLYVAVERFDSLVGTEDNDIRCVFEEVRIRDMLSLVMNKSAKSKTIHLKVDCPAEGILRTAQLASPSVDDSINHDLKDAMRAEIWNISQHKYVQSASRAYIKIIPSLGTFPKFKEVVEISKGEMFNIMGSISMEIQKPMSDSDLMFLVAKEISKLANKYTESFARFAFVAEVAQKLFVENCGDNKLDAINAMMQEATSPNKEMLARHQRWYAPAPNEDRNAIINWANSVIRQKS